MADVVVSPEPEAKVATPESRPQPSVVGGSDSIQWTASEFIAHDKSAGWFVGLAVIAAAVAGLVYLATKDFVSVVVVLVGAVVFGVYAARKPRQLLYSLDRHGIAIGDRHYSYADFRSFAVMPEGAFSSIVFMPLKRFSPALTIYYAPQDEEKIMAILGEELPFEQHRRDAIDSLMKRIRF